MCVNVKMNFRSKTKTTVMKKKQRVYEEEKCSTELNIAVGSIADKVAGSVAAVASGGALSAVLATKLKDFVIDSTALVKEKLTLVESLECNHSCSISPHFGKHSRN